MLHLQERHKELLRGILRPYVDYDIRAYGSRVKGTQRALSDLDLCVMKPIPSKEYNLLVMALEESDLPIFVSVAEWPALSESFKELIAQDLLPFIEW
jgi:uncharacterized protein